MANDLQEIFKLASKHFYKKYKNNGGSQAKIAKQLGITQSYVSAVMSGSRTASLELQEQIANILYGPFEEFLVVGRRIQKKLDPEPKVIHQSVEESVEKLIARLTHYVMDHKRIENELAGIKDFYEDIVQNLQSGVITTDLDDTIFFVNHRMSAIAGIPFDGMRGVNILAAEEKFPVMGLSSFLDNYRKAKNTLKPIFYENISVNFPKGRRAYLSGWLIPKVAEGHYNGMTCTIRDTTQSQEHNMLIKMFLDNSPYAIGITKQAEPGVYAGTYFTNKKMQQLFDQEDADQAQLSIHESLERCEEFIINNKEWREFLQKHFTKGTKGSLVIQHTNGRQYRWISENLLDHEGNPWGRMATVKEVGHGRRKEDR